MGYRRGFCVDGWCERGWWRKLGYGKHHHRRARPRSPSSPRPPWRARPVKLTLRTPAQPVAHKAKPAIKPAPVTKPVPVIKNPVPVITPKNPVNKVIKQVIKPVIKPEKAVIKAVIKAIKPVKQPVSKQLKEAEDTIIVPSDSDSYNSDEDSELDDRLWTAEWPEIPQTAQMYEQ